VQTQTSFQVYNASAGSGKTFILVKEYLKLLLQSDDFYLFQRILAITFTNKAAGEMKERVLKNLFEFSKHDFSNKPNDMFQMIISETGLKAEKIQKRAIGILQFILRNYSAFNIKTIDSFTNKLIKSFAFDLGMSLDFEVELDADSILKETIDVIISKIGIDKELTDILVEFAKQKTLEDKSWDIGRELFEISKLILNENDVVEIQKLENKSLRDFKTLEIKLKKIQKETEDKLAEIGKEGLDIIDKINIEHKDFYYSQFPNFFKNLIHSISKISFQKDKGIAKSMQSKIFYTNGKSDEIKLKIDGVIDRLSVLYLQAEKLFQDYFLNNLILKNLIPLAIINSINKVLEEIKLDGNIRLNAEFNQIISNHLKKQPVAFIYEKIGEKFKHFFIDEMQDTSVLQWENLIPLIDNTLSQEDASTLLVGDAKQAIYRWRGGKAEQFIDLSIQGDLAKNNPFKIDKRIENLDTNFRSYSEIIDFNNKFFTHISKYFQQKTYQDLYKIGNQQNFNSKTGGYVQLKFLEECKNVEERNEIFPQKVYETILELDKNFDRNEISILVRKKTEGITIANFLSDKGVEIVSSETLLIKNNTKVDFIINLLYYLKDKNNQDAKFNVLEFLFHHLKIKYDKHEFISSLIFLDLNEFFKALEIYQILYTPQNFYQNPFYESIEEIIRSFSLTKVSDAHIQFFLDFTFDYSQRKSKNNVSFLDFWEQKKEKLSIIASNNKNAVQIMTIHKSKGLEFPVVIFPYDLNIYYQKSPKIWFDNLNKETYNGFESILVSSSSKIENTGYYGKELFKKQQEELELDNFNLLYVTLTRAKEQLFIITENKKNYKKLKYFSHFFIDFLKELRVWEEGKLLYEFGESKRFSINDDKSLNTEMQVEFISTSWQEHQINIVANSSLLWDTDREDAIKFGNLIHDLMADINTEEDIPGNVNRLVTKGLIEQSQQDKITELLLGIVNHEKLKKYYQKGSNIVTEREILTDDKQIFIPDRLIFYKNKVTIIDYKTGKWKNTHQQQIKKYALVLQKMNFEIDNKLLVYIGDKIEVILVEN
jgi:ATP-dependent exoDNAse (exonuclease V) beta subunit